jgi:hypothetical protein
LNVAAPRHDGFDEGLGLCPGIVFSLQNQQPRLRLLNSDRRRPLPSNDDRMPADRAMLTDRRANASFEGAEHLNGGDLALGMAVQIKHLASLDNKDRRAGARGDVLWRRLAFSVPIDRSGRFRPCTENMNGRRGAAG